MTRTSLEGIFYPQTVCLRSDAQPYRPTLWELETEDGSIWEVEEASACARCAIRWATR